MPKLKPEHYAERIREVIAQLERGEEVEAKKNKTLLNGSQQQALDRAWAAQQSLRKTHTQPKTDEEKNKIGWRRIREVRLEIYKRALADIEGNWIEILQKEQHDSEVRAGRIFMDAFSQAGKEGKNAHSAGNIALTRAGLGGERAARTKRDGDIAKLEADLELIFDKNRTEAEREERAWVKGLEKEAKRRGK